MTDFDIDSATILKVRHGSHAYGTNIEGSDLDVRGVCIPPLEYYFGFHKRFEQHVTNVPNDTCIFGLQKFVKLAADCNPNIIECLFVDEFDILEWRPAGLKLLGMRDMFITKRAKHTFSGYAHSQLKRIRTHRAWLLNPPKAKPERSTFGLPENRKASSSEMGAMEEVDEQVWNTSGVSESVLDLLRREKQYGAATREWSQYQEWKKSRNPKRAELEAKYGYDTKHAGHLIRLMRMCKEILETGKVIVKRPDAEEIKAIRQGIWCYGELILEAERLDAECEKAYETSTLPKSPDYAEIDRRVVGLMESYFR
jgi:predicted nucleotidyltransferase